MLYVILSLIGIMAGYVLLLLGLMNFLPAFIGAILMFISIFSAVFFLNERRRFKGFPSNRNG
ncbi:hypothetical protein [Alteribacillus sp. HJP-4]|uniref:hypothetical protein n=1 Tax=Alteribacillus sp. HJP-4 TaxID=2775394 RepID=UPI0035CCFE8C